MDIYTILKNDHQRIFQAIDAMEQLTDSDRKKDLFSFIRTEIVMHSKAEEEVFYRPLRGKAASKSLIEHSFDEHHEVEHLLFEIQTTSADDSKWMEKIRQLRAVLTHHIQKEETEIFQLAQAQFSAEQAENIGTRMLEEKGKLGMENPLTMISRKIKETVESVSH